MYLLLEYENENDHARLWFYLSFVCRFLSCVGVACFAGDHAALFSAVLAIRTKLVEGTSAPFDLPVRPNRTRPGGGGGGGGGGGAEHNHGHSHGHEDDEDNDNPYNQNGQVARAIVHTYLSYSK